MSRKDILRALAGHPFRNTPKAPVLSSMSDYIAQMRYQIKKQGIGVSKSKIEKQIRGDMQNHALRQRSGAEAVQSEDEVVKIFNSDKEWHGFCGELGITDDIVRRWYQEFRA